MLYGDKVVKLDQHQLVYCEISLRLLEIKQNLSCLLPQACLLCLALPGTVDTVSSPSLMSLNAVTLRSRASAASRS